MEPVSSSSDTQRPAARGDEPPAGRKLDRKQLANRLNALHFRQGRILVTLRHQRFGRSLTLPALPQPCDGERSECRWADPADLPQNLAEYSCINLLLNDGQRSFAVVPPAVEMDRAGIVFVLPEGCRETAQRSVRRHRGVEVTAQFIQNGTLYGGRLLDFTPCALGLELSLAASQNVRWINPSQPAELILWSDQQVVFAGSCRIVRRQMNGPRRHTLVVVPASQSLHRYRHKEFRSLRQSLRPAPSAAFRHPLSGRQVELLMQDVSAGGFSVLELNDESVLLPGLLIPKTRICFTERFTLEASVQVVYRRAADEEGRVRCGCAFLDMASGDHLQLLTLLHRADDAQAYLSHHVDVDQLLDFFFATGFLYPKKYVSIAPQRDALRATYERLYARSPAIARHFVHQEDGQILAHMSVVRFQENAWMIHHHAADSSLSLRAGLNVLNQMGRWVNDSRNIPSLHLDYFYCFFRDTNRFPMRIFGGIAKGVADPAVCSIDLFAYYHHQPDYSQGSAAAADPPGGTALDLAPAGADDLREFGYFYDKHSGGLLPQAMDLLPGALSEGTLAAEFHASGFRRERHVYRLRENGILQALFVVHLADFGLNLSELTSSVTAFVFDHARLSPATYNLALTFLCMKHERPSFPVLLYPGEAARAYGLPSDKNYCQFIFDTAEMDCYFRQLKSLIRSIRH